LPVGIVAKPILRSSDRQANSLNWRYIPISLKMSGKGEQKAQLNIG